MKVKFFHARQQCLNGRIVDEPFKKVQSDLVFGRNKRSRAFIPLVGLTQLEDGDFISVSKNANGTNLLKPSKTDDGSVLVFTTIEGGFRGGISMVSCNGTIIAEASAGAACESAISVAVVLADKQEIVFRETGRYGTFYTALVNDRGTAVKNRLAKEDFEYLYGI